MKCRIFLIFLLSFLTLPLIFTNCSDSVTDNAGFEPDPDPEIPVVADCLESGTEEDINDLLNDEGDVVELCAGSVFELSGSIVINANGQQILTEDNPTDDNRAIFKIVSDEVTTAVILRDFDDVVLSHVIVDGNRQELGYKGGDALIYAGGSSNGQVIRNVDIIEPRSWSALHIIEGHTGPTPTCQNALVEDNVIGPAGQYDGTWADGISLACSNSIVRNNIITDVTDGGIVIFGAPGSLIEGNAIQAKTRTMLGGINMVDYAPYDGNYSETVVSNNIIDADGAVIRIGLGMGVRVWVCVDREYDQKLRGATVENNQLRGAHMQYGFIIDGVEGWTAIGNTSEATHSGTPEIDCNGTVASAPEAFMFHSARADGTFQPEFEEADLELALWSIVNPVVE
jgi:parallel beta-helix repeat protein